MRMDTDLLRGGSACDDSSRVCFYVFNRGEDAGFAIISADDLVSEVLAYSDSGHLDMADLPENLAFYLKLYQEEIKSAQQQEAVIRNSMLNTSPSFPRPYCFCSIQESGQRILFVGFKVILLTISYPMGNFVGCAATAA